MTLAELLQYLDTHTGLGILDGGPAESLEKAKADTHANPIAAEVIRAAAEGCKLDAVDGSLSRVEFVNALGKLRLKYMADDAPVEGFRAVEKIIATADAAYNDEALREREK